MAAFEEDANVRLAHHIVTALDLMAANGEGVVAGPPPPLVYALVVQARSSGLQRIPAITLFVQCGLMLGAQFDTQVPWAIRFFAPPCSSTALIDVHFEMAAKAALDSIELNGY